MVAGDDPEVVRRWPPAARQEQLHLLGNYGVWPWCSRRWRAAKELWNKGLEGFNMQESTIMREWRKEAREEGWLNSARSAVLNESGSTFPKDTCARRGPAALEKNANVQQLTDWQREAALTASPADFERFLTTHAN